MNVWELIKKRIASKLSSESFQNWFVQTSLREFEYDTVWVLVPNEAAKNYIGQQYLELIQSIIRELSLPVRHVINIALALAGSYAARVAQAQRLAAAFARIPGVKLLREPAFLQELQVLR